MIYKPFTLNGCFILVCVREVMVAVFAMAMAISSRADQVIREAGVLRFFRNKSFLVKF